MDENFDFKVDDLIKITTPNKRNGDRSYMTKILKIKVIDLPQIVVEIYDKEGDWTEATEENLKTLIVDEYDFEEPSYEYRQCYFEKALKRANLMKAKKFVDE